MRKKIGVLITGILDDFNRDLVNGVMTAAKEHDADVIVFPGKYYNRDYSRSPEEIKYEYQYEAIFDYGRLNSVDGIVMAPGTIGCLTTRAVTEKFVESFSDKPCIMVADDMGGHPCVRYDGTAGIREGLTYLIETLGNTRIGMIGGPEDSEEIRERRRCYEDTLTSHGVELVPSRYVSGKLAQNGTKFYEEYLDANPDLEAVFCIDDNVAAEFYDVLKQRMLEPGQNISILGYDDLPLASQIYPTLSSVRADVYRLGEKATHMLIDKLAGKDVESAILPTEFIKRKSFVRAKDERDIAQEVVLQQNFDMNNMLHEMREKQIKINYVIRQFIARALTFERGDDTSYEELLDKLEWMELKNAYLYLYEKPIIHAYKEELKQPVHLFMKAKLVDGKIIQMPQVRQRIRRDNMFDKKTLGLDERSDLVLLPLFSNEMVFGVLLCELTQDMFENGDFLCNVMSAAVRMIYLLKSNDDVRLQLEKSLAVLQENNIVLDTLSKSDPLTGILNRRGFYEASEGLLLSCRNKKHNMVVLYVDMNNLKIVNDHYGHEDGDFSLKVIGDTLLALAGDTGIVGRIGGDEFACAIPGDDGEPLTEKLYGMFDDFNKTSDKPYNVTVSAGAVTIHPTEGITLQEALTLADEQLYEVKKLRKKDVAKAPGTRM